MPDARSPYVRALAAHAAGRPGVSFTIVRDDGFTHEVPVAAFFDDGHFDPLEATALAACHGRVLDVGAGAGRHTLALERRGATVTALDVEPGCAEILTRRGVLDVVTADVFAWTGGPFDTVLVLMNGVGIAGRPERLVPLLGALRALLAPGGAVLCDSIDVSVTSDPRHVAYRESNVAAGRAPGQQSLRFSFDGASGPTVEWLHVAPASLSAAAVEAGLVTELLHVGPDGRFLAKLSAQLRVPSGVRRRAVGLTNEN